MSRQVWYRKKPVSIRAYQLGNKSRGAEWLEWFVQTRVLYFDEREDCWHIQTLEGDMTVGPEDYVIEGVDGELYACKPDIFLKTYEPDLNRNEQTRVVNLRKIGG